MVKKRARKVVKSKAKRRAKEGQISQMQTPTDRLEETAMELTRNSEPIDHQAAFVAATDTATDSLSTSAATSTVTNDETSPLMKLPAELRLDILERVLQSVFDARPYGLGTPELPADTRYMRGDDLRGRFYLKRTNQAPCLWPYHMVRVETKLPAVLQLNRTIRNESIQLFLGLAHSKHLEIELENDKLNEEHQAAQRAMKSASSSRIGAAACNARMRKSSKSQWQNKRDVEDMNLICQLFPKD